MTAAGPTRKGRWVAYAVLAAFAFSLGLLGWGLRPVGVVVGPYRGPVERALVVDPQRGAVREGVLDGDRYQVGIPEAAREPVVLLEGPNGSSVRSSPFVPAERIDLPLLALWQASPRLRVEAGEVRADWPPVPPEEGYPDPLRYSLLFVYRKPAGRGEASLLSREPSLTISLGELRGLLKDRDPGAREVEVEVRAFDPSQPQGALWVGGRIAWRLPD
ncbi:MAG: hypothetical protein D6731_17950 [Planctomycetota bacterium]|nr:MAG: hypothetical protein D6731_17950 [Planctomycetota bacterium]